MILLKNVNIVNLDKEKLQKRDILVKNGVFKKIDRDIIEPKAETFDLNGKIALAGLIDAHVHVTAYKRNFTELSREAPSYVTIKTLKVLDGMIERGFTTVRDAGGADFGLSRASFSDEIKSPRILFCGPAISQTGGHGDVRRVGEEFIPADRFEIGTLGQVADGVDALRKLIRNQIRVGAHHVKLMVNGGISTPTDPIENNQFSLEELRCVVEEAQMANTYVLAHAYTPDSIHRALECGVKSIEHGNLIDKKTLENLVSRDAYLTPTLCVYNAFREYAQKKSDLDAKIVAKVDGFYQSGLDALKMASEMGANIIYGTDLVGEFHNRQLDEFAIRSEFQNAVDILKGATTNPAKLFGMDNQIGSIKEGFLADLILLDKNPLLNAKVLSKEKNIKAVMKNGSWVKGF